MEFNKELLEKAKGAKTAEELKELAKAVGVEMTAEEAADEFAELHKTGELADEELDNVSGGCHKPSDSGECDNRDDVKYLYNLGDEVEVYRNRQLSCRTIRRKIIGQQINYERNSDGKYVYIPYYLCENLEDSSDVKWVSQKSIQD